MAENTFKSPGFFEQEIELTAQRESVNGVPAGIIGASQMGPAFVPTTIGTWNDYVNKFGSLSPDKMAPYAVREWLKNRQAITFTRVLGAGANSSSDDFDKTREYGFVKNAGFALTSGSADYGHVQMLAAKHIISANSDIGYPVYTDNDTFGARETSTAEDDTFNIVRAQLFNADTAIFKLKDGTGWNDASGSVSDVNGSNEFELALVLNESDNSWGNDDGTIGKPNRVFRVSLDPDNTRYIGKVLNTDPKKFQSERHLLHLDFAVEHELAPVSASVGTDYSVFLSTGGTSVNPAGLNWVKDATWSDMLGNYQSRYRAPRTTSFISQPFGNVEYDLFHFECLSDGAVANNAFKVSIANLRKSADPNYPYGTFDVLIRNFEDNDFNPQVLERYVECNLDPKSENFVARKIGDKKVVFDFDADLDDERRLVISGKYPNRSLNVRIVMNEQIYKGEIDAEALPFGFRGIPVLDVANLGMKPELAVSNLPPLPFTFKATKGKVKQSGYTFVGEAGNNERSDKRIFWGVKTTRIEDDKIASDAVLESNLSGKMSSIVKAYTKFMGMSGATKRTGLFVEDADGFNNNKFTLARVALGLTLSDVSNDLSTIGSVSNTMKDAAYLRNGVWSLSDYTMADKFDSTKERITLASLVHDDTANNFNKFSPYLKFTNVFYGGFDGLNMLDADIEDLNDKAASTETVAGGKAGEIADGLKIVGTDDGSMMGTGKDNNIIASYRQAIKIMTDPMTVRVNLLAVPGIRDPYVTNFAAQLTRDYGYAMYIMDIPNYDQDQNRIFDMGIPDVEFTGNHLEDRAMNNNYVATYFPDVYITDDVNNRRVLVPASVAALGALGYNDATSYPWFAPAGFNRGALTFVENVRTRLSVGDRDDLYERKINPIANFPNGGFVIFGQKTMQINQSALDRVNVRRLMLEVKRQVSEVAGNVLFEQNNKATRERFVKLIQPRLAMIQAQSGVEKFRVVCDETNNTEIDIENNRLNGKIILVPTRTIEFIAIDFIVTNSGVSFE